VNSDL